MILNKVLQKLFGCGAMVRKDTEQDVENADVGNSERSIEPPTTEQGIELAEISTNPGSEEHKGKVDGSCSIFKIPRSLANIHQEGHEPEIVAIGPYHHNKPHLQMIQEHKDRFLQLFLAEAKKGVGALLTEISGMKNIILKSYAEMPDEEYQQDFANKMLLDGCFILMLFFFVTRRVEMSEKSPHDPILITPWILPTIRRDLLLLENQVPFILLKTLFKASKVSSVGSGGLNNLAFKFFNFSVDRADGFWTKFNNLEAEHLLDLIRQTFTPIPILSLKGEKSSDNATSSVPRLMLSAKRLRLQGIEFKASHGHSSSRGCCDLMFCCFSNESHASVARSPLDKTILDIQLKGNELQIPPIVFDEFISSLLQNCVAFEQLSLKCSNHITNYVVFMRCLLNDEADATYLIEKGIIENYFGNGNDVSQFFRNISSGIVLDLNKSYLKEVFEGINEYTSRKWNVQWARFKHLHFDSPWTCMSSSAVLAILLLTIFQATMAGLSYFRPPKQPSG